MIKVVVVGYLNTDIIASGIVSFAKVGELVQAEKAVIGPGGKPRNIADMTARLVGDNEVAMIGKTVKDGFGLWKPAVDSLDQAGVNTQYISYDPDISQLPGLALIPVSQLGENQIILIPGVNNNLSEDDILSAKILFEQAEYVILTLECSTPALKTVINLAQQNNVKLLFDPGGITNRQQLEPYLSSIFLLKPNEHETKLLTDIETTDRDSAYEAAQTLAANGVQNVLITVGSAGAYLYQKDKEFLHIPVPEIAGINHAVRDATGCGDQTMAALCASLLAEKTLVESAKIAVNAGTRQFYVSGVQPLGKQDIFDNV